MPSFDIVSRVDLQEVDNAVNNAKRQIAQRYDFRGSNTQIDFDRKTKKMHLVTDDKMKMEAVRETLLSAAAKRGIDLKALDFDEIQPAAGAAVKRDVTIVEGIEQDIAKKIVKLVKDAKLKVQASIQGDEVRVTGKKIDDLQAVIQLLKSEDLGVPLQFVNMKS